MTCSTVIKTVYRRARNPQPPALPYIIRCSDRTPRRAWADGLCPIHRL